MVPSFLSGCLLCRLRAFVAFVSFGFVVGFSSRLCRVAASVRAGISPGIRRRTAPLCAESDPPCRRCPGRAALSVAAVALAVARARLRRTRLAGRARFAGAAPAFTAAASPHCLGGARLRRCRLRRGPLAFAGAAPPSPGALSLRLSLLGPPRGVTFVAATSPRPPSSSLTDFAAVPSCSRQRLALLPASQALGGLALRRPTSPRCPPCLTAAFASDAALLVAASRRRLLARRGLLGLAADVAALFAGAA